MEFMGITPVQRGKTDAKTQSCGAEALGLEGHGNMGVSRCRGEDPRPNGGLFKINCGFRGDENPLAEFAYHRWPGQIGSPADRSSPPLNRYSGPQYQDHPLRDATPAMRPVAIRSLSINFRSPLRPPLRLRQGFHLRPFKVQGYGGQAQ